MVEKPLPHSRHEKLRGVVSSFYIERDMCVPTEFALNNETDEDDDDDEGPLEGCAETHSLSSNVGFMKLPVEESPLGDSVRLFLIISCGVAARPDTKRRRWDSSGRESPLSFILT